ncbi:hypothetical protein [Pelistega europaea]|uniref:Lipoprotein n=1 Tax=Pelistega europaea TaxID=106147 RepID=A0A7Y4LAN1_9BURK|nr:hypothetical protein [Pelistega europaea]NOL48922.1 hypothetical protein [Pelistega europaea]
MQCRLLNRSKIPHGALLLIVSTGLSACSSEPYPEAIQQELVSYCQSGITSGETIVQSGKKQALTNKEIYNLCQFRLQEFMKQVPLADYLRLNQHIYDNFRRAYGYKYTLKDIYETLSPDDKQVNAKIAEIILGLENQHEK